jgi:prophage maintenance system killer protein
MKDNEATDLFAKPKDKNWIQSILWAVYQTFDHQDVYPSVEEKAANLLYLTIKNHPFIDWNKRSWAFLFVWFLSNNGILHDTMGLLKINQQTLVALALLVATSNPKEKSLMIRLIIQLLS